MKKIIFFIASLMLSVNVSAASLSLSTAGATGAFQAVSFINNNGPFASGYGETTGGTWSSSFQLTTDVDTMGYVEWGFNPEDNVSASMFTISTLLGGVLASSNVAGDGVMAFLFLASETYLINFASVTSTALQYGVTISELTSIPAPAALFLFGPVLLGFISLRRKPKFI